MDSPRSLEQRRSDTMEKLGAATDIWVATASRQGQPHLVPLSFLWDGKCITMAISGGSRTGRDIAETGVVRLGLGPTRDVVIAEGLAELVPIASFDESFNDEFAAKVGFDPRDDPSQVYVRVEPRRIQAWREVNEIEGRDLMRDGEWCV